VTGTVDLFWLPVGAGDVSPLVRRGSRAYESVVARLQRRPVCALFHSALVVRTPGTWFVIEMAPVWADRHPCRGVVAEGPVGLPWLGRSRIFRYEVRRWRDGPLQDAEEAVQSPVRLADDEEVARRLLGLVPAVPTYTWGRDEAGTGDMWNSNSLVSWLLVVSGLEVGPLQPPAGGRAPGWSAGLAVARRAARQVPAR
jgi:hypothetical protein